MTLRPLAALALLSAAPAFAAPPSAAERTMIATVDAEQARSLALLERAVNQNSGTRNLAGVKVVHEIFDTSVSVTHGAIRLATRAVGKTVDVVLETVERDDKT